MSTISRADFPTVSDLRFWRVKHNAKSMAKPVTLELHEYTSEAAREKKFSGFTRLIGFTTTTADKNDLLKAAFELHRRVNDVDDVVGEY